jgi:hypothetical protein
MAKKQLTMTYAYLYASAKWAREQEIPTQFPGYDLYRKITYLSMLAFTLEGYLNHCGDIAKPWWKAAERTLSTEAKMEILSDHCSLGYTKGSRPMQTLLELQKFRNEIAHGKTIESDFNIESLLAGKPRGVKWLDFARSVDEIKLNKDFEDFADTLWRSLGQDSEHPTPFGLMGKTIDKKA